MLTNGKADANARDLFGETPLRFAVAAENVECARQLIAAGADALCPNTDRRPPLLWALEADTKAVLLDGCWQRVSFIVFFLLTICAFIPMARR